MQHYDTVLFDLDGTIIDTNELIIHSILHVWNSRFQEPLPKDTIIRHMGRTIREQFQAFTGEDDVDEYIAAYRSFNAQMHDDYVKPFPYVREVMHALKASGVKIGAVTTKMRATTQRSLAYCGLDKYFDCLVTVDDVQHPKPHPEPVLKALEQLRADRARALMVGDSPFDIQAAHEAGVRSVAVGWSLKGEDELRRFAPHMFIRDMRELLAIIGVNTAESEG